MIKRLGSARSLLASTAGIAIAMALMNVGTYSFQMVAARLLGPVQYGAIASLMALMLVVGVVQLGLQATAARRIAAEPEHVARIEREMLRLAYRVTAVLALALLALAPVIDRALKLGSLATAAMVAVTSIPLTIMGAQAGILQGERRWLPLSLLYLAVGVPRVLIGAAMMWWQPTALSGMTAVAIGLLLPVAIGAVALRRRRREAGEAPEHNVRALLRETAYSSQALLAFYVLINADILVARNALDEHQSGLYAAGLILAKAVLFLPQFVIVVAFPSLSDTSERRTALFRGLGLVAVIGAISLAGSVLLSPIAMVFVGGDAYGEIEGDLWAFAILGTLMAMLQLLVYAGLARQGRRAVYLVWFAAALLVLLGPAITTGREALLGFLIVLDGGLFVVLLGISLYRMREPARA
ncbi:polysaccharide biosynthesis protein [Nocardioides dubius]|uniref:Polysaccharide biosynthesis protein n=1 Tax=Nocardioides dubius TaxID=317019 RepID=A0ABN1TNW9_9ACTN